VRGRAPKGAPFGQYADGPERVREVVRRIGKTPVWAFHGQETWCMIGYHAVPVIAVTSAAANISAIAGGILVFGDPMPGRALGIVAQSLGLVAIVFAAALMPALGGRRAVGAATA